MAAIVSLSSEEMHEIFSFLHRNFADMCLTEEESSRLKSCIEEANGTTITKFTTKRVLERYFQDRKYFSDHPDKNRRRDLTVLFKSCYVLICFYQHRYAHLKYKSVEELKQNYPQFAQRNLFDDELQLLLRFRNLMRIALVIIDAQSNKHVLLKIAGRLEGSHREYITGGGQTLAVKCRVEIYEREGAVQPKKRPERKPRLFNEMGYDDCSIDEDGLSPVSAKRSFSTSTCGSEIQVAAPSRKKIKMERATDPQELDCNQQVLCAYRQLLGAINMLNAKFQFLLDPHQNHPFVKGGKVNTGADPGTDKEAELKALRAIQELTQRADTLGQYLAEQGIIQLPQDHAPTHYHGVTNETSAVAHQYAMDNNDAASTAIQSLLMLKAN